jgi:hypothetical protein
MGDVSNATHVMRKLSTSRITTTSARNSTGRMLISTSRPPVFKTSPRADARHGVGGADVIELGVLSTPAPMVQ